MNTLAFQITQEERAQWMRFCENLGAMVRTQTLMQVIDDCVKNPRLSEACLTGSLRLLDDELCIIDCNTKRGGVQ